MVNYKEMRETLENEFLNTPQKDSSQDLLMKYLEKIYMANSIQMNMTAQFPTITSK